MRGLRDLAVLAAATMMSTTPVLAAPAAATRSVQALPQFSAAPVAGTRISRPVERRNNLLGAPLFIAFLGAVAVTIGTIVIVNNNNDSPG